MIAQSADIPTQNKPFITSTKCTVLIKTNMKGASTKCFGISVPSSGRTKCPFQKPIATDMVHLYGNKLEMLP